MGSLPTSFHVAHGRIQDWVIGGRSPPARIEGRFEGNDALERMRKPPTSGGVRRADTATARSRVVLVYSGSGRLDRSGLIEGQRRPRPYDEAATQRGPPTSRHSKGEKPHRAH